MELVLEFIGLCNICKELCTSVTHYCNEQEISWPAAPKNFIYTACKTHIWRRIASSNVLMQVLNKGTQRVLRATDSPHSGCLWGLGSVRTCQALAAAPQVTAGDLCSFLLPSVPIRPNTNSLTLCFAPKSGCAPSGAEAVQCTALKAGRRSGN